jgi:hypothetical protein
MSEGAEVTMRGVLSMQVCVPEGWDDYTVKRFADRENLCGTSNGWFVRKDGDKSLEHSPERVQCASRPGFVHIMLDA